MSGLPSPLLVWSLALAALALGLRSRARRRPPSGGPVIPAPMRMALRLPIPAGLARLAEGPGMAAHLVAAAAPAELTPGKLARCRVALAAIGLLTGAVAAVVHPAALLFGLAAAGVGYLAPVRWVTVRARERRRRIVRDLPDMIDLVVICAESGMALEPSLRLAAARLPGPLAEEVGHTLRALDLGTPRRAAYSDLAGRIGAAQLTGFVAALLQADELGVPIAAVLRRQADLLRSDRTQDIRERSARAAPKVQLVVALLMVPAALIVVIGVLVIQLVGQIGGVTA